MTAQAGMPLDFWEQVRKVAAEEVAKYARSGPSRNSSITGGSGTTIGEGGELVIDGGRFRAKYPANLGGGESVYIGDIYVGGNYTGTGLLAQSPSGVDMILARQDTQFGNTRVDLYDSGNRVIVGNDAATGQGLARPYLEHTPYLTRYGDWRTFTMATTDVWETIIAYSVVKQHPRLEVCVLASMDTAATTGELRVLVDGVQLDTTASLAYAQGPNTFGPDHVLGGHMAVLTVEVQARRTTATGGIKAEHKYSRSRQSP